MSASCNFDGGECASVFSKAGTDALMPCNRSACSLFQEQVYPPGCWSSCFIASCDFSKFLCNEPKSELRTCPLFDAVAYVSYAAEPKLIFPEPSSLRGSHPNASWPGGYQGYARCVGPCQAALGADRSLLFEQVSGIGLVFGAAACPPLDCIWAGQSRIWAWSASSSILLQPRAVRTVEFSLRLAELPAFGAFRVAVSSETFAIGVAGGHNGSALLSLVLGSLGPYTCEKCKIILNTWTHVAVSIAVSRGNLSCTSTSIYINGTSIGFQFPESGVEVTSSFVGPWGLALGRKLPDAVYLTQLDRVEDDNSTYFDGAIANLRLWGEEYRPSHNSTAFHVNCSQFSKEGSAGLLACVDLNGSLQDVAGSITFSPRYGDKFLPWCTAVDDSGEFLLFENTTNTTQQQDNGKNWGFCSDKRPLPSAGYDYEAAEMESLAISESLTDIFSKHPGCGRVPIRFIRNRATGKGGAVYRDNCDTDSSRRSLCFIDGNSPQTGYAETHQVLFVGNVAGIAGGAVYVECVTFGQACIAMLNTTLALPIAGGPQRQIVFDANYATGWGNDLATAPARIEFVRQLDQNASSSISPASGMSRKIPLLERQASEKRTFIPNITFYTAETSTHSKTRSSHDSLSRILSTLALQVDTTATSDRQYVPGIEAINFTVVLFDNSSMIVRGSDDVLRVRVCASVANGDCFDDTNSLIPVPFFPFNPRTGLCTAAGGQPIVCASGRRSVYVQFSLAGSNIAPLVATVDCLPCPPASSQEENLEQGTWKCVLCGPDQYVIDSNNPSFTCEDCPAGAECNGSTLSSLVPGAVWVADLTRGQFLLQSCPPGYFIVNTDSHGVFSYDMQACSLCPATFYCLGGILPRSPCPSNSFAPAGSNSSAACKAAVFLDVSVRLPISATTFSVAMQQEFTKALAKASGVANDRVTMIQSAAVLRRSNESGFSASNAVIIDASIAANTLAAAQAMSSYLSEAALNEQLLLNGLPAGILVSLQIREDLIQEPVPIGLIVGIIVPTAAVLICVGTIVLVHFFRGKISPDEVILKNAVTSLRKKLGIMPHNGFILSTESVPWFRGGREVVYLQRGHVEAAARVCLYQHFDVHQFDSFCLCLEGERGAPAKYASCNTLSFWRKTVPNSTATVAPYQELGSILLGIAASLIRPDVCTEHKICSDSLSSSGVVTPRKGPEPNKDWLRRFSLRSTGSQIQLKSRDDCPLPVEMRSRYFTNYVRKVRMWQDDDHKLFRRLQVVMSQGC